MAFEKAKRKKILNHVAGLFTASKFGQVHHEQPAAAEVATSPSIFIFWGSHPMRHLTNVEKQCESVLHVVGMVSVTQGQGHLENIKTDLADEVEAAFYQDITLGGLVVLLNVRNVDSTAFSLAPLGVPEPVLPPYGAFRMDVDITFDYLVQ